MSRKVILALPILAAGLTSAHAESARNYEFSNFDRIEAEAGLKVSVQYAEHHHVEVIAKDSGIFEKIVIEQSGDSLIVKRKDDWSIMGLLSWADNWTNDAQINISTPQLVDVEASSGAEIRVSSFDLEQLSLEASSGAELRLQDITVDQISLDASSGASLSITGACDTMSADASSGADIKARDFDCANGKVEAHSGADINAQLSQTLKAEASSGGSIKITGNPQSVEIEKTFGGSIDIMR